MGLASQKKKWMIVAAIALLLLTAGGVGGYLYLQQDAGEEAELLAKTDFHRFYPDTTMFFAELSPGEKLSKRFMIYLEKLVVLPKAAGALQAETPKTSENSADAQAPEATSPESTAETLGSRDFFWKLEKSFGPAFSIGFWAEEETSDTGKKDSATKIPPTQTAEKIAEPEASPPKTSPNTSPKTSEEQTSENATPTDSSVAKSRPGFVLAAFVLKPAANNQPQTSDLSALIRQFGGNPDELTQTKIEGTPCYTDPKKHTSMAIATAHSGQKILLVGSSPETIKTALTLASRSGASGSRASGSGASGSGKNVFEQPDNKKLVDRLAKRRAGTLVFNNSQYMQLWQVAAHEASKEHRQLPENLSQRFLEMAKLSPVTVGEIRLKGEDQLIGHLFTPVRMDKISDESMKTALNTLYNEQTDFKAPKALPSDTAAFIAATGLDKHIHFYLDFMSGVHEKEGLNSAKTMLSAIKIDLDKDVIGLFRNESILSVRHEKEAKELSPVLILSRTTEKEASLNKLLGLLPMLNPMMKATPLQIGSISAQTFPMPKGKIGFASLPSNLLVFGTPQGLTDIVNVHEAQAKNLSNDPQFQTLAKEVQSRGNGMVYLNLEALGHFFPVREQRLIPNMVFIGSTQFKPGDGFESRAAVKFMD